MEDDDAWDDIFCSLGYGSLTDSDVLLFTFYYRSLSYLSFSSFFWLELWWAARLYNYQLDIYCLYSDVFRVREFV